MRSFTDKKGKKWTIELTLSTIKRVKADTGHDLLSLDSGEVPLITRLMDDEILLGEIIASCLHEQIADNEDVLESFDGKTTQAAADAFFGELEDFFRQRGRLDKATAISKVQEAMTQMVQQMTNLMKQQEIVGISSISLPESSE